MGKVLRTEEVGEVWLVWDGFGGCTFDLFATEADAHTALRFYGNPRRMEMKRFSLRNATLEHRDTPARMDASEGEL